MNWGMIGHSWAVSLLAEHIAQGHERHAYLITGPQGVGRRTLAIRFAQGLNCQAPPSPGQPCMKCSSCKRIESLQHPDLAVVESEGEGEVLRIDQVRELQHTIALAPFEARYRVALLLRFEEAHISAANAMLKTLEEPPPKVVVILTAQDAESLLPTIVSRCEVIRLRPVSVEETSRGLQAIKGVPAEMADQLAHFSGGRPGYAVRLYTQPQLLAQRQSYLEDMVEILQKARRERFEFAVLRLNNRDELRQELQIWHTFWRDVLVYSSGITDMVSNLDYSGHIQQLANELGMNAAQSYVKAIENTIDRIDHNINPRLALEVLLLDLPRVNKLPSPA